MDSETSMENLPDFHSDHLKNTSVATVANDQYAYVYKSRTGSTVDSFPVTSESPGMFYN